MNLDEAIELLKGLRDDHGGTVHVIDDEDHMLETAEFNDDDGKAAVVLLFDTDGFAL